MERCGLMESWGGSYRSDGAEANACADGGMVGSGGPKWAVPETNEKSERDITESERPVVRIALEVQSIKRITGSSGVYEEGIDQVLNSSGDVKSAGSGPRSGVANNLFMGHDDACKVPG